MSASTSPAEASSIPAHLASLSRLTLTALALTLFAGLPPTVSAKGPADRVSVEEGLFPTTSLIRAVGPLYYTGHDVDDDMTGNSLGDNDGVVESGETIELYVEIWNAGDQTATGLNATISTSDPYVTFTFNTSSTYGDIAPGAFAVNANDFDFDVASSAPAGEIIVFDLSITASNGGPWTDSFVVVVDNNNPTVAMISDQSELLPVAADLGTIGFDVFSLPNNWDGAAASFTSSLATLMQFDIVAWYGSGLGYGRLTTPAEANALESYVEAGGRLLVTGYDTIGSPDDSVLAEIVRSSTVGDGPFEYSYSIVDAAHPIATGPYGFFPNGFELIATYSDHDDVHAIGAAGAVGVARLASGADKIIATDLDPAPASGRIVYWNGNLEAQDWIGPPPSPVAHRVEPEVKPGAPSNEALRASATPVTGAELPAAANLEPTAHGLRLEDATIAGLTRCGLRQESLWTFPSVSATYAVANDPYWFQAGDQVSEAISTGVSVVEKAHLDLVISENLLTGGASVDLALSLNGTPVGTFSVLPGEFLVSVEFAFPGIPGPSFTVVLSETNTVPAGQGSIVIPTGVSTLTFIRHQHELFRNTLAWLGDGATRLDPNEVNDTPGQCTPILLGVPVSGVYVDPAGDLDYYCLAATAGQGVYADVDASEMGSALDPVLTLLDPGGTPIAESDDVHGLDPFLTFVIPATGTYSLRVRSFGHPCCGGSEFFYTLLVDEGPVDAPGLATALPIVPGIESMSPVPATGPVAITYGITRDGLPHRLVVYDVAGRLVRTLASGPSMVGRHRAVWDGRSGDGHPSVSGVYFVALGVGEERWTEKVMLLR
jgi:hypothetical protein